MLYEVITKLNYEEHHNVKYTDAALQAAAKLASKYITDRFLPDKAIDLIDEAGSFKRISNSIRPKELRITSYNVCYTKLLRIGILTSGMPSENQVIQSFIVV